MYRSCQLYYGAYEAQSEWKAAVLVICKLLNTKELCHFHPLSSCQIKILNQCFRCFKDQSIVTAVFFWDQIGRDLLGASSHFAVISGMMHFISQKFSRNWSRCGHCRHCPSFDFISSISFRLLSPCGSALSSRLVQNHTLQLPSWIFHWDAPERLKFSWKNKQFWICLYVFLGLRS